MGYRESSFIICHAFREKCLVKDRALRTSTFILLPCATNQRKKYYNTYQQALLLL
ncbi:MAG TPA: hypothetical protein VFR65_05255 [Nitrososphaeraceae archaeon]|nr:hypothetical protein [Nitrososphaeraceae archaeon]